MVEACIEPNASVGIKKKYIREYLQDECYSGVAQLRLTHESMFALDLLLVTWPALGGKKAMDKLWEALKGAGTPQDILVSIRKIWKEVIKPT